MQVLLSKLIEYTRGGFEEVNQLRKRIAAADRSSKSTISLGLLAVGIIGKMTASYLGGKTICLGNRDVSIEYGMCQFVVSGYSWISNVYFTGGAAILTHNRLEDFARWFQSTSGFGMGM